MRFFQEAVSEIQAAFLTDGVEKYVGPRLQLVAAYTLAEVFSSYWDIYRAFDKNPDERMRTWLGEFCFTSDNDTFQKNPYFKRLNAQDLISLRNSLIHFFGLSDQAATSMQIAFAQSHMKDDEFAEYISKFPKTVVAFKPIDFYHLFKDGALLMLNVLLDNIHQAAKDESKKWEHIEGINRLYEKVMKEGAVMQPFTPRQEGSNRL